MTLNWFFTFRLWVWMKCPELSARGGQSKHQKKTRRSLGPCLMSRTVMMTPGKWDHLHSLSSPDRGLGDTTKHLKGSHCPIGCILCDDIIMTKKLKCLILFLYIYIYNNLYRIGTFNKMQKNPSFVIRSYTHYRCKKPV